MKDLGFGLADQRSVIIVLFTLGFSTILLGNPLPIDTSSAESIFLGLVTLTGFIYFVRSVGRVIIVLGYFIVCVFPNSIRLLFYMICRPFVLVWNLLCHRKATESSVPLRQLIRPFRYGVSEAYKFGRVVLFECRDWKWKYTFYGVGKVSSETDPLMGTLGVLDRMLLILLVFISTLPLAFTFLQVVGIMGIGLLILIYIFEGRFTLILKDALHKVEDEREELVVAAAYPHVPPPPSTVRIREREYEGGGDVGGF